MAAAGVIGASPGLQGIDVQLSCTSSGHAWLARARALGAHLRGVLPDHALPVRAVTVDALPLAPFLLLILLTWIRIAAMIFMLYWGLEPPSFEELVVNTFLRPASLPFLVFGTAVGALFAFLSFAVSAVSIPMLAELMSRSPRQ